MSFGIPTWRHHTRRQSSKLRKGQLDRKLHYQTPYHNAHLLVVASRASADDYECHGGMRLGIGQCLRMLRICGVTSELSVGKR